MTLKRLIPIVLVKNGLLVRSQIFKYHQAIGDPIPTIKRLSDWNADEIILLNIGNSNQMDSRREDKYHSLGNTSFAELVNRTTKFCHCPVTIGGGIRQQQDIENLFNAGADKVVINNLLFKNPEVVKYATQKYGSQAITASIDILTKNNKTTIWTESGSKSTHLGLSDAIELARSLGVGEILISSINNDGSDKGYDQKIIDELEKCVDIDFPIIINSGATKIKHFEEALKNEKIAAVAASNIFYFTELSYPNVKSQIIKNGYNNLRKPEIDTLYARREPQVINHKRNMLMAKADIKEKIDKHLYDGSQKKSIKYCRRCLYSSSSATPMQFDNSGLCMGCRTYETKAALNTKKYAKLKDDLINVIQTVLTSSDRKTSEYDCIVSVSGGKDSYYQTHYVKNILGLNPLLVTYNGNNYTKIGWNNLWNMREAFNCDHIIVSPAVGIIKKLNKLAFIAMGDMNWHAHVGIFTTAPRVAVQQNIPLIFWGEHGYADLCGQFSMNDFPEMNYRERTEHAARGFDWPFFVGLKGITNQQMNPWKYPSDQKLHDLGLRQIYLGHYIPWESNSHLKQMIDQYGFQTSNEPFERTYRIGSNLDDMHENGVHDYMKYIKFGYGRCTDHASKDIRSGDLNRSQGIELVKKMDHIKPKDLQRWLEYVDMSEDEFDRIADYFRDPRVWQWSLQKGWEKDSLEE